MRGELVLSTATLLGFLLTLARVGGVFVFVPLPGIKSGFDAARVVLCFTVTIALFASWPRVTAEPSIGLLVVWTLSEAALGIGIGLAVSFVLEGIGVAAQVMGLQAGYAFASTIDPNTQADSGILVVFSQLVASLLFFAMGLDREVLRIFAASLVTVPAGSFVLTEGAAARCLETAGVMFSTGVRLALPVIAVLVMVDISLALLGRINSQLQLLMVAFPIKMLLALTVLGWIVILMPAVMRSDFAVTFAAAKGLLVR
jgi:flagellar biosynthetic protein FliR